MQTRQSQRMRTICADRSVTIKCHSHRWDAEYRYMRKAISKGCGHIIQSMMVLVHAQVHNCHVKNTRSKRLSDTVQFQHKYITKPTITQADKHTRTIHRCTKLVQGGMTKDCNEAIHELKRLAEAATRAHKTGTLYAIDENEQALLRVTNIGEHPN